MCYSNLCMPVYRNFTLLSLWHFYRILQKFIFSSYIFILYKRMIYITSWWKLKVHASKALHLYRDVYLFHNDRWWVKDYKIVENVTKDIMIHLENRPIGYLRNKGRIDQRHERGKRLLPALRAHLAAIYYHHEWARNKFA